MFWYWGGGYFETSFNPPTPRYAKPSFNVSCDFLFVQEHWLVEERLHIFSNEINGIACQGVSGMDSLKPLVGRPYGECSVSWKSDIAGTITPIQTQSKHLCCLLYECNDNNLLIFNVYMPVDDPHRSWGEYEEILDEIKWCVTTIW